MILSASGVGKSFIQGDTSIQVLKNLNFNVNEGETYAIVGKSGAGKSTLLSLLTGLAYPDEGSISVNDVDITKLNQNELIKYRAQNIGIVFQQFHLLPHLTALENVELALEILRKKDSQAAKQILQELGLEHRLNHYPSQLSGGECQRVAIARAFVVRPSLLFADEPSGNLDEETGKFVMDMLLEEVKKRKMTMVLVTHNRDLAKRCMHTYQLDKGMLNLCS